MAPFFRMNAEACPKRPAAVRWSTELVVFQALLMVYEFGVTLCDRFQSTRACVIEMFPSRRRPGQTYQGFIKAQNRLSPTMVEHLQNHLRAHHGRIAGRHWKRFGWIPFACDGSRVEVPRTKANDVLGCAGRAKTGPQLFVTTLYHMGTGLPWNWHIGAGTESERDHLRAMLASLPAGSLIVGDAGFTGYDLLKAILSRELSFLIRVGSNVTLLTDLGFDVEMDGDVVWLWPEQKRQKNESPLKLRLIRIQPKANAKQSVYLLTNVFDRSRLSDETAAMLYRMRWGVEVFYRSYKQTLERRKLRSDAPQQARWELHWGLTALLLLGLMSVEAIIARGRDPLSLSVATALRHVRHAMRTARCWRRRGDLRALLSLAIKDGYRRHGSKTARDWPHKKKESPPGAPKIRPPTQTEIKKAQKLRNVA